jgi:hypothetical protein
MQYQPALLQQLELLRRECDFQGSGVPDERVRRPFAPRLTPRSIGRAGLCGRRGARTPVPRLIGFTLLTELRGLEPDTHGKFCSPCLLGHGISSSPNV